MPAVAYKRAKLDESYDAIVIGSGMGGLTTASLLARHARKRVLVLERHYEWGGFTHVFRRPGYEWDVGVHYIGNVSPGRQTRRIFDHLTDGRLDWAPMPDVYDRIFVGDRAYDFPSGVERFREQMKQYFPEEGKAIDGYLAAVFACQRWMSLYMAEKVLPRPLARLVGGLLRWPYLRWAGQTTSRVLRRLTRNPELVTVLTGQWGDYGLPPAQSSFAMHAAVAAHYFGGAAYPVGGSSRIAADLAPAIEEAGGCVVVSAEVASIIVEGNRVAGVRMADGREVRAPIVVSDAGAANTALRLLPPDLPATRDLVRDVRRLSPSMAHLCLHVGLRQALGEPGFEGTNLWIYRDVNHDAQLARFVDDPSREFPVLFISFPSAKDPTFSERYPGRATIEVVAPAPFDQFERWADTRWKKRGDEYDALKAALQARLLDELERRVPAVKGRIEYVELSTPLSTKHFAGFARGEVYGLAHTPERFRARNLGVRTGLRGLYLTGADACLAGVTGAMMGGVLTASAVLGRNLLPVVAKGAAATQRARFT